MPIHDWTRVRAQPISPFSSNVDRQFGCGFELRPTASRILRAGRTNHRRTRSGRRCPGANATSRNPLISGIDCCEHSTQARFVIRSEAANYARKADRISIRHPDGDVVAVIEIVSPGNKDSSHAIRAFARKAVKFLQAGIHLLVVDLFPPNRRNPQGIHKVIWDRLSDESFELPPDKPLTLAAYAAGPETVAYIEPVAVGDILPDQPIFLTTDFYVNCPLEATYQATWSVFPAVLKTSLEQPEATSEKS